MSNPRLRECECCLQWFDRSELTRGLCKYCIEEQDTPREKDVMDYKHEQDDIDFKKELEELE